MTSKELIGQFIDLETQMEWTDDPDEVQAIQSQLEQVQQQIAKKVDNIDDFIVELQRRRNLIQAEIDTYRDEQQRLYKRRNAVDRTKDYLENSLLPTIIRTMGRDNIFETPTSRYTLYETFGSLQVIDEAKVPDDYLKIQMSVDKAAARKALMNGTKIIPGLLLEKIERVRRS